MEKYSKIKQIPLWKSLLEEMKRQARDEEKIWAGHISDKALVLRIYKEIL